MPIGITEEHEHLRTAVRRFVDDRIAPGGARARRSRRRADDRPAFWDALDRAGLDRSARRRGARRQRVGLVEQAVVVEELGRACAPGPVRADRDRRRAPAGRRRSGGRRRCCPRIVERRAHRRGRARRRDARARAAGRRRDRLRGRRRRGTRSTRPRSAPKEVQEHRPHAPARAASTSTRRPRPRPRPSGSCANLDDEQVRLIAATLFAAEAIGVAQWCVDTAAEYAQGARAVRPSDRPVPGREAPLRRDARARRARPRRGVGRGRAPPTISPTPARALAIAAAAALAFDAAFVERQGLRADARWHRLHVGARRAHLPAARDDAAPAHGTPDDWRVRAARGGDATARAAGSRSTCRCREARGVPRPSVREFLAEVAGARPAGAARPARRGGLHHARLARAVGPRRQGARAARDRRGVPRRRRSRGRTSASARGRCRT